MYYSNTTLATFHSRSNRFIALVEMQDGTLETVHVKNTGRCKELLLPGVTVSLQHADNSNRKTQWDLIGVIKPNLGWVNIDSQVPNRVVREWLESKPEPFADVTYIKSEYKYGNSRIDFYMEAPNRKILLEVKGCTLEIDGQGDFPDAPTQRGVKHLGELASAISEGYETYIVYCIAMEHVTSVLSNREMDGSYAAAYENAMEKGVNCICLNCKVTQNSIVANEYLKI